jgi:hypothetical protein
MQHFFSLLSWRLFTAHQVLGVFPPIIRSPMTAVAASGRARHRTQHDRHHDTKVKPEAATAVIELLMTGGRTPETCWAVNKRHDNKLKNCCIRLVIYFNCTMMHGLTKLKFILFAVCRMGSEGKQKTRQATSRITVRHNVTCSRFASLLSRWKHNNAFCVLLKCI